MERLAGEPCLVTGGAGAIGSNLVGALVRAGARVTVLDDLSSGSAANLAAFPMATLVTGDVGNPADVRRAFAGNPRFVFHLAAQFANQNSVEHPVRDCTTNALGTLHVLEAARGQRDLARFVYASSSCVLGHQDGELHEGLPTMPDTPYGASKLAGEIYTLMYRRLYGLPTSVVRYFNVYGPGERPGPYRNVLPNFVQRALRGAPLVITGTGDETREFVFVEDAVRGTILAATHPAALGELFHIGSGAVRTIRALAESVRQVVGDHVAIEYAPRRGWDSILARRTRFTKAATMLGYAPEVSFEDGLARTVAWIRELQTVGAT